MKLKHNTHACMNCTCKHLLCAINNLQNYIQSSNPADFLKVTGNLQEASEQSAYFDYSIAASINALLEELESTPQLTLQHLQGVRAILPPLVIRINQGVYSNNPTRVGYFLKKSIEKR